MLRSATKVKKMSIQKDYGKETVPELLLQNGQAIRCFVYQGKIALTPEVARKTQERIDLWSKGQRGVEWACVCTGKVLAEGDGEIPLITDFYELPAWNLNRQHGYTICLDDIARIGEKNFILTFLHSHPSGNLFPSSGDMATFIYTDLLLGRPILHIIASPNGEKLIISFAKCWECPNSFFKLIRSSQKHPMSGGEKRWEAST